MSKQTKEEVKVVMAFEVNGRRVLRMDRAWALSQELFKQGERPVHARFTHWERLK